MATRGRYNSARHSEDDYDDYSDDFISDEESRRSAPLKNHHRRSPPTRGRGRGKGRGRGGGRGQGHGRNSQARSDPGMDVVAKRLLSASRLKISELQNQTEDLRRQLRIVTDENKLYKRMQHKQEKALEKFEDRESDLPQLIQAHNNEVRTLKEHLRRAREKYEKTDRYLRDAEDDLEKAKAKLKKYKDMVEKKELAERSELDRKLNQAELTIEERDSRIKELERHLEHLKKNHRHELGIERARSKESQRQADELREYNSKLEAQLKEKEKLLEMKNIYSNRFLKPASYNGTPNESPAPQWRANLKKKSPSEEILNNPREKARMYEEKRREEHKKRQESRSEMHQEPKQKWEEEEREKDADQGPHFNFTSARQDSEAEFWRRQEEEYKRKRDEANRETQRQKQEERRQREEDEKQREQFRQQREKLQRDMEEREKAERHRREQDEHERREREERERKDRERKEAEARENERKAREREERERREKEEQERKAREEREQLENDPRLAEERRKKDELLRRLQQLDSGHDADPFAPATTQKPGRAGGDMDDPFSVPSASSPNKRANRDPFFLGRADSSDSTPSSKKDYTFTRSVENLHHGKPSRDDVSVPYIDRQKKARAAKEDAEIGGYQPSFSGPGKSAQQKKPLSLFDDDPKPAGNVHSSPSKDKKSKLMEDLFGPQASKSAKTKDESEDFFLTNKKTPTQTQPPPKRSTGFPWDDNPSSKTNGTTRREGSTLFAGGAALVDEDTNTGGNSSVLLPRRPRQMSSTFSSKPTVTAVDNLDDSLEEVIL